MPADYSLSAKEIVKNHKKKTFHSQLLKKSAYNKRMKNWKNDVKTAKMIAARLERLSADSVWAHRANWLRGSLLRQLYLIEHQEKEPGQNLMDQLSQSIVQGYAILSHAAKEIPDTERGRSRQNPDMLLERAKDKARLLISSQNRPDRPFRDRFQHTLRVLNWAERLQELEGGSLLPIQLAVLFHDTGWDPPRPHAEISAELAATYFSSIPLPADMYGMIIDGVRKHNLRHLPAEELNIEEQIIMDADLLDEVGVTTLVFDAMNTALEDQSSYEMVPVRGKRYLSQIEENIHKLKTGSARKFYTQRLNILRFCYQELEYELGLNLEPSSETPAKNL